LSVSEARTDWRFFRPVTLVCLAIVVCAFAWGLGYKLDLYGPPHSAVHKLPEAKLLSKNEQTWLADAAQTVQTAVPARIPLKVCGRFFIAMVPTPDGRLRQELVWLTSDTGRLRWPALPALPHQLVRPPPNVV
jgi:hypothetical protein